MPSFGPQSKENMEGVHPDIVAVLNEAIKIYDFSVLEGLRSPGRQKGLVAMGKSLTLNSKHLRQPDGYSHAVDIAPYPVDWENKKRFSYLAGIVVGIAATRGVVLEWGGFWRNLEDCPHIQLRTLL